MLRALRQARLAWLVILLAALTAAFSIAATARRSPNTIQTAIVLDFENKSGYADRALARLATDAFAVELANSGQFDVLKRAEVERQASELNLKPPYDQIARSRLATAVGATVVVDGSIEVVRETVKKGVRLIQVGILVRVTEASSGDLLSGAAVIGESRSVPTGKITNVDPDSIRSAVRASVSRLAVSSDSVRPASR